MLMHVSYRDVSPAVFEHEYYNNSLRLQTASHPVWNSLLVHGTSGQRVTPRSLSMTTLGCDDRWGRSNGNAIRHTERIKSLLELLNRTTLRRQ
jgi:hypothetical protein